MRTKTVFNSHEIAHVWAHKQAETGRCAANIFFEGKTIYSYGHHFPIACFVESKRNGEAVLMTMAGYSNTTEKHKGMVRSAISHLKVILAFEVPNFGIIGQGTHEKNFAQWLSWIKYEGKGLAKARKPEIYIHKIMHYISQVKAYCDYFEVKPKGELKKIMAGHEDDIMKLGEKLQKIETKKAKDKEKIFKAELKAFRAFAPLTPEHTAIVNSVGDPKDANRAYLRYNSETQRVETSKGVQIPAEIARRFYSWVKKTVNAGGCDNCKQEILHYSVKAVNSKDMMIGCHTIAISEADTIAKALNW
jgi:hypothetical protein